MNEDTPESAVELLRQADQLRSAKRLRPAVELIIQIIDGRGGPLAESELNDAFNKAMEWSSRLHDWPLTETLARRAVAQFPRSPRARLHLGEALYHQSRLDEAAEALDRAVELAPERPEARVLRDLLQRDLEPSLGPPRLRAFPKRIESFEQPRDVIRRYVLGDEAPHRFISRDSVFVSMGSCFAENLSARLNAAGYQAHHERVGEEVNSTYANRYLLDWVEHGAIDHPTEAMDRAFGSTVRDRLRDSFQAMDVFVLTLGVAPCFFHRQTGEFTFFSTKWATLRERLYADHVMRTTTVDENVENIRHIVASVRRLTTRTPKVVLTVSPVPLAGTTEYESAVIADCVSKSTLRVAADRILREQDGDGILYWPSFEIVRWLGSYYGRKNAPVFGGHDGKARHVSPWVVDMIIDLFLERHSEPAAETAQAAAAG